MTVYGPVPSRRLGRSLGINTIPAKVCSYSCVYCQLGNTGNLQVTRQNFCKPEVLRTEVEKAVRELRERGDSVDYLTFVADGEPTLSIRLGQEIDALKSLGVKTAVITNASLIWRADVRDDLARADLVSFKIDTVNEELWRRINRPHKSLILADILTGALVFSERYKGTLITDTMLISGLNDNESDLEQLAGFLAEIDPDTAYLAVPTRPPAVSGIKPATESGLNMAFQIVSKKIRRVELLTGYEGNEFSSSGDPAVDLLNITAVHPMREDAVSKLLEKTGSDWAIVESLIKNGQIKETEYSGHRFYLRAGKA